MSVLTKVLKVAAIFAGLVILIVLGAGAVLFSSYLLPAKSIELDRTGGCPQMSKWRMVSAQGYFGGYVGENIERIDFGVHHRPVGLFFNFSAEPGGVRNIAASVPGWPGATISPDTTIYPNTTVDGKIFDNHVQKVGPNDRVRITGIGFTDGQRMAECQVRIKKIQKL